MKTKLSIILTAVTALGGVSYAFADGLLNDAAYTREHGGVGNLLFRYSKDVKTADTTAPAKADADHYETADTNAVDTTTPVADTTKSDDIDLGASSAGRAH